MITLTIVLLAVGLIWLLLISHIGEQNVRGLNAGFGLGTLVGAATPLVAKSLGLS